MIRGRRARDAIALSPTDEVGGGGANLPDDLGNVARVVVKGQPFQFARAAADASRVERDYPESSAGQLRTKRRERISRSAQTRQENHRLSLSPGDGRQAELTKIERDLFSARHCANGNAKRRDEQTCD
jgi:hypothetical protein